LIDARSDEVDGGRARPSWFFVVLASYASAMTIACIWLWWHAHRRVDLPSPETAPADARFERSSSGEPALKLEPAPPLPLGQVTSIGKPLKVDDLELTPMRVMRSPVLLEHQQLDGGTEVSDGGQEALVLQVRLRNVSRDQIFTPLDAAFLRPRDGGPAESFVETSGNARIEMYPLAATSELSIAGQTFRQLKPGEEFETTIVSDKDTGDKDFSQITWRIRLRTAANRSKILGVRCRRDEVE
jgi:hypothetical protein